MEHVKRYHRKRSECERKMPGDGRARFPGNHRTIPLPRRAGGLSAAGTAAKGDDRDRPSSRRANHHRADGRHDRRLCLLSLSRSLGTLVRREHGGPAGTGSHRGGAPLPQIRSGQGHAENRLRRSGNGKLHRHLRRNTTGTGTSRERDCPFGNTAK